MLYCVLFAVPLGLIETRRRTGEIIKDQSLPPPRCHLRSLTLSLLPNENEREQNDIHRVGHHFGDLEAHVARLSEETAPYPTMGFGNCCVGVFVHELRMELSIVMGWTTAS